MQSVRDVANYYRTHGGLQLLRHAFAQLSVLKRQEKKHDLVSILSQHFLDGGRELAFPHEPLVSIIICSRDGIRHLSALSAGIAAQAYRNFELIFVDNASADGSADYFIRRFPNAKVIRLDRNRGFAEANNIGYLAATGELIALLNNDTVPQDRWLSELVEALRANRKAACAVPKLLFNGYFSRITIDRAPDVLLSVSDLLKSLDYPKVFINGNEHGNRRDVEVFEETILHLPAQSSSLVFRFSSRSDSVTRVVMRRDGKTIFSGDIAGNSSARIEIDNAWNDACHWHRIINNAGSVERFPFEPADRGYGEVDRGQYDQIKTVDYLCGCAPLIRRSALDSELIFRPEFFAYFEDSELSLRLRRRKHTIMYVPTSVVLHTHSATANSNLDQRTYLIERNRLIFKYLRAPALLRRVVLARSAFSAEPAAAVVAHRFSRLRSLFSLAGSPEKLAEACRSAATRDALTLISAGLTPIRKERLRVCIYDEYWSSCGGGEAHALEFARHFSNSHTELTLASTSAIDTNRLSRLFDVDLKTAILLCKPDFCSADTRQFDLFINSTYQSTLVSQAKHSIFIVSFPSRNSHAAFRSSYFFAFNSEFTRQWSAKYWGAVNGMVIEPVVRLPFDPVDCSEKKNLIISVGRFSNRGHGKNQLRIARAFIESASRNPENDWQLVLAGTLDQTSREDVAYYQQIATLATDQAISLVEGGAREEIWSLYKKAKIYVHAAGLGVDSEKSPELSEHFGMTVAEAIEAKCFVIVHDSGNPPILVRRHGFGAAYKTEAELVENLQTAMKRFEASLPNELDGHGHRFSTKDFNERLSSALAAIGFDG
ncbi:MAG: N-glycosyltransferase [Candidatus Accumulibacter appositus]|uniref:N-glycosyltransferase n=1 Tax=Candidatus Accumulibacter appositus TaxID=1454003 RepID=A0A011QIK2_9PROT|nr:glycosyltransferase [Accumulibacter sp.]EXI78679.1 MAG: N-glycosyltransferase [Candidatus Accumulibacter appositus]HRF03338.1 glycosyltransferase [Accumulibacter sp.]